MLVSTYTQFSEDYILSHLTRLNCCVYEAQEPLLISSLSCLKPAEKIISYRVVIQYKTVAELVK